MIPEKRDATELSPYKYNFLPNLVFDSIIPKMSVIVINNQKMKGTLKIINFPNNANSSSIPPTLAPPVITIPIPWNNVIVPNVAINGGADVFEINIPLNSPTNDCKEHC